MLSANDLRKGNLISLEGEIFSCTDFQRTKAGKGGAFIDTKLKNIKTGKIINKRFRSEDKLDRVYFESRKMTYLYKSNNDFMFMDNGSYEQVSISKEILGDALNYLKENMEVEVNYCEGNIISIELPLFVKLKVINSEPVLKGDRVTAVMKQVELETGYKISVPMFINEGETITIDTRTGEYLERG
ncbi:MAG: elongation factor P [bacterium]